MRKLTVWLAAASILAVSACSGNESRLERAVVAAAIGCAAGQVLVESRCVEGAIVGAGVAALTD